MNLLLSLLVLIPTVEIFVVVAAAGWSVAQGEADLAVAGEELATFIEAHQTPIGLLTLAGQIATAFVAVFAPVPPLWAALPVFCAVVAAAVSFLMRWLPPHMIQRTQETFNEIVRTRPWAIALYVVGIVVGDIWLATVPTMW